MHVTLPDSKNQKPSAKGTSIALVVAILLGGLIGRLWLVNISTRHGYVWDHFDMIGRGMTIREHGLLNIYTVDWEDLVTVPGQVYQDGRFVPIQRRANMLPNYPPIDPMLVWLQVKLLPEPIWANTFTARLIMSASGILGELALAVGLYLVGLHLFGRRAAMLAGTLCWLFPPIAMNSAFWGQIDGLMLAPAVFMLLCMFKQRWTLAGFCFALACLIKPLALILGPIILFAVIVLPGSDGKTGLKRVVLRLIKLGGAFVLSVVVLTLPWMITSGLAWVKRCYVGSFLEAFPYTTLKAFNIWYLDALIRDAQPTFDLLNSKATIAGLTKDTCGRLLIVTAMIGFALLCWWRYRRSSTAVLLYSGLWLWSIFMLPTRVHERFIIYCIPLFIAALWPLRRLWPVVILLALVGMAEMSWPVWLDERWSAGSFNRPMATAYHQRMSQIHSQRVAPSGPGPTQEDAIKLYRQHYNQKRQSIRKREWIVTVVSLVAYASAAVLPFVGSRQSSAGTQVVPAKAQRHKRRKRP